VKIEDGRREGESVKMLEEKRRKPINKLWKSAEV
jgi:hypothetical protein